MNCRSSFLALLALVSGAAHAAIGWTIDYDDPFGEYPQYRDTITANLMAAGRAWSDHLEGSGTIDVHVSFANIGTADASATTSVWDHTGANGAGIRQWGTAYEINTGIDPNGASSDIEIRLGRNWMNSVMWWDPTPDARTAPIPAFVVDGQSVLMHEIGHGLAFNGWMSGTNANMPFWNGAPLGSMYDEHVTFDGSNVYFNGANAMAAYGGPVPLTYGNYAHYGNGAGRPGRELAGTRLMNGVVTNWSTRWGVTDLDLGFLADTGYTLKVAPVPEPASFAVLGLGAAALIRRRKR